MADRLRRFLSGLGLLAVALAANAALAVPSFTSTPVTAVNEDAVYTYNVVTTDPTNGQRQITATTIPSWLTLGNVNLGQGRATLSGTPTQANVGTHAVVLLVRNLTTNQTATQSFTVTVANVNDAPSFTSAPVTAATEDAVYTYNVTTADPDTGGTRTISAPTLPSWLSLTNVNPTNGTATLTGTPTQAQVGNHNVTLRVTDNGSPQLNTTQSFTIAVANANDAPSFTSAPVTAATEDTVYTYNVTTTDPDTGGTRTISAPTLPSWLSLTSVNASNGTATLTGTPTQAHVGNHSVTLRVTDNGSPPLNANQTFTITVGNVNDAPSFTSTPVTAASEDVVYTYNVTTADPDTGGTRTISAPTLPSWLALTNVNPSSGTATLTGTPTQAQAGNHSVTLRVTDNGAPPLSANQTFTITVANTNDVPVITGQTPNPIVIDRNTSLTILFSHLIVSDPDDTYPSDFSLTVLSGSNYTQNGNTITPATNFVGTLTVLVRVNDGAANSNTFNLQVSVQIFNRPPEVVAPIPSQTGTEAGSFQLRNAASAPTTLAAFFRDLDGDTLRYEVTGLPPSGSLVANPVTGEIVGIPLMLDASATPYVVRVTANDSKSLASELPTQTFNLLISALSRVDIGLTITVTPAPAGLNTAIGWSFAIINAGALPAGPVDVTAEFAGNPLLFGAVQNCIVTPVGDRQRLTCSVASIGAGASATVVATGRAAQAGDASVTADVSLQPGPIDPNPANNHASATVNVAESLSVGPAQVLASNDSRGAAAGDIDGDGFVDLALAKGAGPGAELYLNVPVGANSIKRKLSDTPRVLTAPAPAADLALVDLDSDTDLDLVMASSTGQGNTIFRNDGLGAFTLLTTLADGSSNGVAAADFDGDRFVDLAFANSSPNTVYLNRGGGTFTRSAALDNDDSRQVIAVDFDLDNLPDLVFANANGPSRFYRNIGGGNFAPGVVVDAGGAVSVASADFNRDGRPDLVLGQLSAASGPPTNVVYQNNPGTSGPAFVLVGRLGASPTVDVLTTDIDLDGAADVIVITSTGTHQVYRGNGAGGFALYPVQFSSATAKGAALGRFSVDARMDLAVGGTDSTGVFINDGRGALGPGDISPPVIQLVGLATVTVTVGDPYQDGGATATDDIDGNLTSKIVTQNPVNTSIVGNYTVTYNVIDTSGNVAQATRTVRVGAREGTGGGGGGAIGLWELALGLLVSIVVLTARPWGNSDVSNRGLWMRRRHRGGNGGIGGADGVCRG